MADDSKKVSLREFARLQAKARVAPAIPASLPEEGLRLLRAFMRISDPQRRTWLVRQSEQIADLKSTMK
jgi:hypothetical protein